MSENIDEKPVRVFKCPCEGNKFKVAGELYPNPSLVEKREHGELLAMGCKVEVMPLKQFRDEGWEYCSC